MNEAIHQFLLVILQGLAWVFKTVETVWVWSWSQIASVFDLSWSSLPGWKITLAIVAVITLLAVLAVMFMRGIRAFQRIAAAFWTMAITMFGILTFVVAAGLFSSGVTWVVASVPDDFWQKLL